MLIESKLKLIQRILNEHKDYNAYTDGNRLSFITGHLAEVFSIFESYSSW